nr:peptidase C48, SUMO/sentrin/Ubl1 [Tanacetum cinerariifolium]
MSLKLLTTSNNTAEPVNLPDLSLTSALNTLEHNTQTQETINSQEVQPNQQPTSAQLPSESTTITPRSAQTQQSTQQHITAQHLNTGTQPTQTHPMVTRSKVRIVKSNIYALREPHRQHAMLDEYNALIGNDGSLSSCKAGLVANGRSQQQGSDDTAQPKTTIANKKPYGITNIKNYIPIVLDLNELNYDSWSEIFTLHCNSFGVLNIIEGTSSANERATEEQWDFGLCRESDEQVSMLRRMRFKIATKIMLHTFNVHAEKMFELAFKFESVNEEQRRISIIINAIKNRDERDPAKTNTFVENQEDDAFKNK